MDDARFDAEDVTRRIIRSAATASLGTLAVDGGPFVTFVTVATDIDGAPLLLLSGLAAHTQHLSQDDRVSLLLQVSADAGDDPLTGARATVNGRLRRVARDEGDHKRLLGRFLARHPEARGYAGFGDFAIYRMAVDSAHLVAGFGRIARLAGEDILVQPAVASAFAAAEASLIETLTGADRRLVAIDPDGVDVMNDGVKRLSFSRRARDPGEATVLLGDLR